MLIARTFHAAISACGALMKIGVGAGSGDARPRILPAPDTSVGSTDPSGAPESAIAALIALAYELLDAHLDTVELAAELPDDPGWEVHLHYLRGLQRKGREVLAQDGGEVLA